MAIDARNGVSSHRTFAVLAAVTLGGVLLRTLQLGGVPFQGGDDISTAWATTWYFPRGWRSFQLGDHSVEPNPLGIVTLGHGPLQVMVALAWVASVARLGVPITETIWHLPFALLGGLVVPMVFLLCTRLQSRRAGILAAVFVAVVPLHVAFSRTSGESHYVLASLLQVASLALWWRYLETGTRSLALATGVAVGCDVLTDFSFPGLILTLIFATALQRWRAPNSAPGRSTLADLVQWRLSVPVLAGAVVHAYAIAQAVRTGARSGMYGRFLAEAEAGHTRLGGVFVEAVTDNLRHATNGVTLACVVVCVAAFLLVRRTRTNGATLALFWACVYLLPLVFLIERGRLIGHYIPISVALCVFTALVLDTLLASRAALGAALLAAVMTVSLMLATLSAVYRVAVPALLSHQADHGGVGSDPGTKAAAWWVRQHTPHAAVLFTDAYAQQTASVSLYYYHRPVVSVELGAGTSVESSFELLSGNLPRLDVIVVGAERAARLPDGVDDAFRTSAVVTVDGRESLHVLTRRAEGDGAGAPDRLEANLYSDRYDAQYATLQEITALPLREIVTRQAEMVR